MCNGGAARDRRGTLRDAEAVRHHATRHGHARVLQGPGRGTRCAVPDADQSLSPGLCHDRETARHALAAIAIRRGLTRPSEDESHRGCAQLHRKRLHDVTMNSSARDTHLRPHHPVLSEDSCACMLCCAHPDGLVVGALSPLAHGNTARVGASTPVTIQSSTKAWS